MPTIARLGDESKTHRAILETAVALTGADTAHLTLVDQREQTLYGVASSGRRSPGASSLRVELSGSASARRALRSGRPVVIKGAHDDRRGNPKTRGQPWIGGVAFLPLLSGRQTFGLLILATHRPHSWSRAEVDLARRLASFASVALENHRLLRRLAETEARFRSLVEHIPAIVYTCEVEPPWRTLYISPQVGPMLGYAPRCWIEDPDFFMEIVHPKDADQIIDIDHEAARGSGFARNEYRLLDSRGGIRWFREEAVLVRDPGGTPVAWHGVMVEITGLKQMQQERSPGLPAGGDWPPARPPVRVDP
jgi:PAS domain S-box-containing protein